MSFDVYLIPSSATPTGAEAHIATGRALTLCRARWGGPSEADIILSTGEEVEFYGPDDESPGGMFALRGGLTPALAQVIFEVADVTRCFVTAPLEGAPIFRTPSNDGTLDPNDADGAGNEPFVSLGDAGDLMRHLTPGVDAWSAYAADVGAGPSATDDADDDAHPAIDPGLLDRFFKRPGTGS